MSWEYGRKKVVTGRYGGTGVWYMESNTGDFIVKQREWSGSNNEEQGAPWSER